MPSVQNRQQSSIYSPRGAGGKQVRQKQIARPPSAFRAWAIGLACAVAVSLAVAAGAREVHLRGTQKPAPGPAKAAKPPEPQKLETWSEAEVAAGLQACAALLKGIDADYRQLDPIRHGACGAPAPVELRGLGSTPRVTIDPPATLNCAMAASLAKWYTATVQPTALSLLKSPVVSIRNAASYDCRNRYGDPAARLSEHAKANAMDILSFTTAAGSTLAVADHWGPTLRVLLAAPAPAQPTKMAPVGGFATTVTPAPDPGAVAQEISRGDAGAEAPNSHKGSQAIRQARLDEAARRGMALPKPATAEAKFIHAIHADACKMFGTVLGPEANDAHKDHLHLDMTDRGGASFCE